MNNFYYYVVGRKAMTIEMLFLLISVLSVGLDQITKLWVLHSLRLVESVPLIEGVFHLTYVENRGAAFGIFQNQRWIFIVLTIAVVLLVLYAVYIRKFQNKMFLVCGALVCGGAVGNLIDRIFRGVVVDMFDFRLIHFPVFNVADICVCVGVILAGVYYIFFDKEQTLDKFFEKDKKQ